MNQAAHTALLAIGASVSLLLAGSTVLFFRVRGAFALLQLLGASCLMIVVLAHVSEAADLFPRMEWGRPHSAGHYVDLWSAVLGLTLFPVGYLLHAITWRGR